MLSNFGKILRKYRIDHELLLRDMADAIGISIAFLSAVEVGKKKVPADLIGKLSSVYCLDKETIDNLREAAALSNNEIRFTDIDQLGRADRETILAFAKNFESLDAAKKKKLLSLLKGGS